MVRTTVKYCFSIAFFGILAAILSVQTVLAQQWEIVLDTQPRRIAADGRSTSQVTARVLTAEGQPVPDGLEVRFNTTAGTIVPVARVTAGTAQAVLTSGSTPNIAQITAIAGNTSSITEVEFVSGDYQAPDVMLTIEGEIGYSLDFGILIASESTLTHGGLRITAQAIEFDERRGQVRAQGDVRVSRGDVTVHADALWYTPQEEAGAVLIMGRVPQQVSFRSENLDLKSPQPVADIRQFDPFRVDDGRSWITAERAVIWPRERIQFTRAVVLVNERPVLTLPHYFYDYRGHSLNPIHQQFRYTAYEGVVVDLPFYFQFQEQRSAGLRVRYAGRGSSYGGFATPRKGFSLGLEQMYNAPGGGGRLFADSFVTNERTLEWNHNQSFAAGRRLNASVRYQPSSPYTKNAVAGNLTYGFSQSNVDMTVGVYGNRSERRHAVTQSSAGSLTTRLDARTRGQAIQGTGLSWRATGSLVRGPVGTRVAGGRLQSGFYQSVGIGLSQRPISLGIGTLTLDSVAEQTFGARETTSLRGRAVFSRAVGNTGDFNLSWDQEFSGGQALSSAYRRSLTASITAGSSNALHGYAYMSWLPDINSVSISATASQPLAEQLRLDVNYTHSSAGFEDFFGDKITSRYSYTRVSLIRPIGLFELAVSWSPQGRDFGLKKGQKFWFDIGSRAF